MMTPDERYQHDPVFRQMVDLLEIQIREATYTPSELRQAVILAAIHYEQTRMPGPIFLDLDGQIIRPRSTSTGAYEDWSRDRR
jgi:hypothetical protein